MEQMNLYLLIYELKGIVESRSELEDYDTNLNDPLSYKIQAKVQEIIEYIEGNGQSKSSQEQSL